MSATGGSGADMREMCMAHAMFRREFGLIPSLVRGVWDGDADRAEIIADHFDLVNTVFTHHDHAEDVFLWPRLLERVGQEAGPVVEAMESQHAGIGELEADVVAAFGEWRGTGDAACGEVLSSLLDELVVLLKKHLVTEETLALPLVEKYITVAEWRQMVDSVGSEIAKELTPVMFGLMMYEGDPGLIDEIVGIVPAELGSMLKSFMAQVFASHAQLDRGTSTPPRGTT